MTHDHILNELAPCGLSCGKCAAFAGGPVQTAANNLKNSLGPNFSAYAQRFKAMNPVFNDYSEFAHVLDFLAKGSCTGCRNQGCLFQACKVPNCIREQDVDFCFQCDQFPCAPEKHGMPGPIAERWQVNNERMARHGVEAFFAHGLDKPRYP